MSRLAFLTKRDSVVELLRTQILRGEYPAGTQLRQDEIAQRLGVSSTPVREAFSILEAEGFVERRAHRGVAVTNANYARVEEVYELRGLLEAEAVRRVIARGDDGPIEELRALVMSAATALGIPEVHEFRVQSVTFHQRLVHAAGSATLDEIYGVLANRSFFYTPLNTETLAKSHSDHLEILQALTDRDEARARDLVVTHMGWNAGLVHDIAKQTTTG